MSRRVGEGGRDDRPQRMKSPPLQTKRTVYRTLCLVSVVLDSPDVSQKPFSEGRDYLCPLSFVTEGRIGTGISPLLCLEALPRREFCSSPVGLHVSSETSRGRLNSVDLVERGIPSVGPRNDKFGGSAIFGGSTSKHRELQLSF